MAADLSHLAEDERTFCPECYRTLWRSKTCKRRDCPTYAPIYLRDQAERLRANLAAWEGEICLVTLTAGGAEELPWDPAKCPEGPHRCSGKLGCRVQWVAAAAWNATVTSRLGELLKTAREQTRRRHGSHGSVIVLGYVCEAQARGVFHPHVILGYRTAADRSALDTFRDALRRKRGSYGFGTGRRGSFDAGAPGRFAAREAARYVSKYLRPDRATSSFVPLLEDITRMTPRDPRTGRRKQLVRPVYVSTRLTRLTGVTMGFLRFKRWVWRALGPGASQGELLLLYNAHRRLCARPPRDPIPPHSRS